MFNIDDLNEVYLQSIQPKETPVFTLVKNQRK